MNIKLSELLEKLSPYFLTKKGDNRFGGNLVPDSPARYDIGSPNRPIRNVYASQIVGVQGSVDMLVAAKIGGIPGFLSDVLQVSGEMTRSVGSNTVTIGIGNSIVRTSRQVLPGAGLSGGGDLGSDVTISLSVPGTLSSSTSNSAMGNHTHAIDSTIARSAITISAGVGLTGGGDLTANRTITLGTPSNLSATTTNSVSGTTHTHAILTAAAVGLSATTTNTAGTSASLARADHTHAIATGSATTLSVTSTNTTGSSSNLARADHTHAITSSSDPGATASILASDAGGALTLVQLTGTTRVRTPLFDTASGVSMTISPALDLILNPGSGIVRMASGDAIQASSYASQTTGWRITDLGEGDFRYLFADELHVKSFIADLEQALAGGQIIAKSVAVLAQDFTLPSAGNSATLRVRDLPSALNMAVFQSGDFVGLRQFSRADGSLMVGWAWGTVTGYVDGTGGNEGTQTWTFTRHATTPGTASGVVYADSLVLDFGTSGNGFYEVNAIDGAHAQNSPYAQVVTWSGHPATQTVRTRFGNLRGITNVTGEFGLFAGSGTAVTDRYIRVSSTAVELRNTPLALFDGANNTALLSAGASNNSPFFAMGSPLPTAPLTNTGIWMGLSGGAYQFRVGSISGGQLSHGIHWDGSSLNVKGQIAVLGGSSGYDNLSDRPDSLLGINPTEYSQLVTGYNTFSESMENSNQIDQWISVVGSGEMQIVESADSRFGGNILRVGNNSGDDMRWLVHARLIPYNPNKLYKMTVRVRRTAGNGTFFAGFAGVAADGVTLVNSSGSNSHDDQHYFCASDVAPPASFTEYTGYFRGFGATAAEYGVPSKAHPNVRYFRPLVLVNYNGFAGIFDVDYVQIVEYDWPNEAGLYATPLFTGYYDGNNWRSYFDRFGNFAFGQSGDAGIFFSSSLNRLEGKNSGGVAQWYADGDSGQLYAGAGNTKISRHGLYLQYVEDGYSSSFPLSTSGVHVFEDVANESSPLTSLIVSEPELVYSEWAPRARSWTFRINQDASYVPPPGPPIARYMPPDYALTVQYNDVWYKVWHEGNGGHGSGLDADTLDGYHASSFALLSGATFSGDVVPNAASARNLGSAGAPWLNLYVDNIIAGTITGTSLSGSIWQHDAADMYIRSSSAAARTLYVANPGAGTMHLDVEGNITLGGTVDGVDVSSHASDVNAHHARDHVLATNTGLGATHTISGATAGYVLRASGATTAAFAAIQDGDLPSTIVRTTRQVIAGNGLTGGGVLSADVTLTVGAGTLISVGATSVGLSNGTAQYQIPVTGVNPFTPGYVALSTFAGTGLSFTDGKFVVGQGAGLTVSGTTVALTTPGSLSATTTNNATGSHTHAIDSTIARSAITISAGVGLTGGGNLTADRTISMGTPSALSATTTNSVSGTTHTHSIATASATTLTVASTNTAGTSASLARADHTHAITSSSNPGAAASLLSSNASGYLRLVRIGLGMDPSRPLDVSGDAGISGQVIAGSGQISGALTVGGNFSVGTVVQVNTAGTRVGINKAADQQFDLDVAGAIRGQYLVGRHAIQLTSAVGVWHFDGSAPYNLDFTGSNASHVGVGGTESGGVIYRRGRYGKAVQIAQSTTNLITNPSFETGTTGWTTDQPSLITLTRTEGGLYGNYFLRVTATGTGNVYCSPISVNNNTSYTASFWYRTLSSVRVRVFEYGTNTSFGMTTLAVSAEWVRHSISFVTPSSGSTIIRIVFDQIDNGESIDIDGVQVEQKEYPTPYCDGSLGNGYSWGGTPHASTSSRTGATLTYANNAGLNGDEGTIMMWARHEGMAVNGMGLWGTGANAQFDAYVAGNGILYFRQNGVALSASGATANTWNHYAFTWSKSANVRKVFLNGVEVASRQFDDGATLGSYLFVGSITAGSDYSVNGLIDEFVLLDYAADPKLIRAIYESDAPVFVESSVFHWRSPSRVPIWVDEFGFWSRGVSGNEILGLYGGDPRNPTGNVTRSWGGITMEENDVVIGRTSGGYIHWDDSTATMNVRGNINAQTGTFSGFLTLGASGGIYQGSGTAANPTTGLKIWNDSGVGRIAGYNGGTAQWWAGTDGRLYAGGGNVALNANGIELSYNQSAARIRIMSGATKIFELMSAAESSQANTYLKFFPISDNPGGNLFIMSHNAAGNETMRMQFQDAGGINISGTGSLLVNTRLVSASIMEVTSEAYLLFGERSTTPANPTSGNAAHLYMKADKLIIQYNESGTVRYKYLSLTGTGVTWVHTTTPP